MEESIRNQLPGTVKSVVSHKVLSEVILETSIGEIASIITTRSVQEMKLNPGDKVLALVKATQRFPPPRVAVARLRRVADFGLSLAL